MRPDGGVAGLDVCRQIDGDGWRQLALFAAILERQTHGVGMRDATRERLADGGLELGGPIAVQQPQQRGGDGAEIVAALAGALEQGDARRRRPCEPVSATMTARGTFACDEGRKMRGILDLSPLS